MTHRAVSRRLFVVAAGAAVGLLALARPHTGSAEIDVNIVSQVPLTIAAAKGDVKKVHDLIISGTPANLTDQSGTVRPAIGWAALEGHTDVVLELLKAPRIQPNYKDKDGNTALILAAQRGHSDTVDALIQAKVNLNLDNKDGMTAMIIAAQNGFARCVALLVKAGADTTIQDRTGRTALDWAQDNNRQDVISVLRRSSSKS
jgi:ankyrin repeat protein